MDITSADDAKNIPLVGPSSDARVRAEDPELVRLHDGSPIYYAFLQHPDALHLDPHDVQTAKGAVREIISSDPNKVLECQGKTAQEARAILGLDDSPPAQGSIANAAE